MRLILVLLNFVITVSLEAAIGADFEAEEEPVQRELVDVSLHVSKMNQLDMRIKHLNETYFCDNLHDDLNFATAVRADNGSMIEHRGSNGVLLQSSNQNGVECRFRMRNTAGSAYTTADVPTAPGDLSGIIVLQDGRTLEVEKQESGRFEAIVPKASSRRRLDYIEYKCKCPKMQYLKIGVVTDEPYLKYNGKGDKDKVIEGIKKLFKEGSIPYEKQFNIRLVPARIMLHNDPDFEGSFKCMRPNDRNLDFSGALKTLQSFRRKKAGKHFAGWYVVTGCKGAGVVGMAYVAGLGRSNSMPVGSGKPSVSTFAHEVGHMIGASHTFKRGLKKYGGYGLMDYKNVLWKGVLQFHPVHESRVCKVVKNLNDKDARRMVSWDERWQTNPDNNPADPPITPTDPPSTPTDPPSTPTDPPSTPTDPPSTPTDPPSTPADPPSTPTDPPGTPADPPTDPPSKPTTPSPDEDSTNWWLVGIIIAIVLCCLVCTAGIAAYAFVNGGNSDVKQEKAESSRRNSRKAGPRKKGSRGSKRPSQGQRRSKRPSQGQRRSERSSQGQRRTKRPSSKSRPSGGTRKSANKH